MPGILEQEKNRLDNPLNGARLPRAPQAPAAPQTLSKTPPAGQTQYRVNLNSFNRLNPRGNPNAQLTHAAQSATQTTNAPTPRRSSADSPPPAAVPTNLPSGLRTLGVGDIGNYGVQRGTVNAGQNHFGGLRRSKGLLAHGQQQPPRQFVEQTVDDPHGHGWKVTQNRDGSIDFDLREEELRDHKWGWDNNPQLKQFKPTFNGTRVAERPVWNLRDPSRRGHPFSGNRRLNPSQYESLVKAYFADAQVKGWAGVDSYESAATKREMQEIQHKNPQWRQLIGEEVKRRALSRISGLEEGSDKMDPFVVAAFKQTNPDWREQLKTFIADYMQQYRQNVANQQRSAWRAS